MEKYIMNMDRCMAPRPVTFVAPADGLYRGLFVQITGMAANNVWLAGADDFEAYKVVLASGETERKDLLIHTTVPKMYDERLDERDYVAKEGDVCRGHYITEGDEYTLPVAFVDGVVNVGAKVGLGSDGKLEVGAGNPIGEVVRVYNFNGQPSCMIRFY